MRLLKLQDDPTKFSLVEYLSDIPPYAILSHTWGDDGEEVLLKDIVKNRGRSKLGYKKLEFCAKQAKSDSLDYIWVDTCCIDRTSSAELTEAANSMFAWYHGAVKCYTYLSDHTHGESIKTLEDRKDFFHHRGLEGCRWFKRGWTLQELIAPACVEFLCPECGHLGDKASLMSIITRMTGIPTSALNGSPLSQFSVSERFSWAEGRHTKRAEDAAYCLLGLFDIHMLLIYGEGRQNALSRLRREIRQAASRSSMEDNDPTMPPSVVRRDDQPLSLSLDPSWQDPPYSMHEGNSPGQESRTHLQLRKSMGFEELSHQIVAEITTYTPEADQFWRNLGVFSGGSIFLFVAGLSFAMLLYMPILLDD